MNTGKGGEAEKEESPRTPVGSKDNLLYIDEATEHLLDHDALIVFAPGLGVHSLILNFLKEYHLRKGCHPGADVQKGISALGATPSQHGSTPGSSASSKKKDAWESLDRELHQINKNKRSASLATRLFIILNMSCEEGKVLKRRARYAGLLLPKRLSLDQSEEEEENHDSSDAFDEDVGGVEGDLQNDEEGKKSLPFRLRFKVVDTNESSNARKRQDAYCKGGVFVISARILVTDLLCGRLPAELIDGLLVAHAHSLVNAWNSVFILRLFRQKNLQGAVKGFSDKPDALIRGNTALERVIKLLMVRAVHFYPRFHASVMRALDECETKPLETSEVVIQLSQKEAQIQECLFKLLKKGLQQLQRVQEVDVSQFTFDECCFKKSFDMQMQDLLDPVWKSLPQTYRKLVQDMGTFRALILLLINHDAIHFLTHVDALRESLAIDSRWLLVAEWELMRERARERVYRVERREQSSATTEKAELPGRLILTLEAPRKWSAVMRTLKRIARPSVYVNEGQSSSASSSSSSASIPCSNIAPPPPPTANQGKESNELGSREEKESQDSSQTLQQCRVLIVTAERATATKLEQVLLHGPKATMLISFKHYLAKEAQRRRKALGVTEGGGDAVKVAPAGHFSLKSLEAALLIRESERLCCHPTGGGSDMEAGLITSTLHLKQFNKAFLRHLKGASSEKPIEVEPFVKIVAFPSGPGDVSRGEFELELRLFNPDVIFIIDPSVNRVREIEAYCSEEGRRRKRESVLEIYIFVLEGTAEHQQYLYNLHIERTAWEHLIQQKKYLVLPHNERLLIDQTTFADLVTGGATQQGGRQSTRKAGGQQRADSIPVKSSIIVDQREFRSSLPFQIHSRGIDVVPVTLLVADYVLSRDCCIERKSPPDFASSLSSGRLFTQAKEMCRFYRDAALLLEYGERNTFSLSSRELLGVEKDNKPLISKLCILISEFPHLRLLWSPTTHFTADLFIKLKEGRENPDPFRAALIGSSEDPTTSFVVREDEAHEKLSGSGEEGERPLKKGRVEDGGVIRKTVPSNTVAIDTMRKLPGITNRNAVVILRHVRSISELVKMSFDDLKALIGE